MEIERRRNQLNELRNHYDSNYKTFSELLTQKKTSLKGTFSNNNDVKSYFFFKKKRNFF